MELPNIVGRKADYATVLAADVVFARERRITASLTATQ